MIVNIHSIDENKFHSNNLNAQFFSTSPVIVDSMLISMPIIIVVSQVIVVDQV